MPNPRLRRMLAAGMLGGGVGGLTFLARFDFNQDMAAPLPSPYSEGNGSLTITDTNNKLSVASGKLTFATGGVGAGDPGAWGAQLTRAAGLALVAKANVATSVLGIGWDNNNSGVLDDGFRFAAGSASSVYDAGVVISADTIAASTDYQLATVQRGAGFFNFIKGGAFTNWTLIWVGAAGTANKYPSASASGTTSVGTVDFLRVLQLATPFNDSYGLATQRSAGAQSAGQTFTHEANFVGEYTVTTVPGGGSSLGINFRVQDANNRWQAVATGSDFQLWENVAGVFTKRAEALGVLSNGHRVIVVADGQTIRGYSNNVLRWTYSSATNFQSATSGSVVLASGAISDLVTWPRTLSGAAAAALDAAVA